jgi:superfamily II DNA or RNA helicase
VKDIQVLKNGKLAIRFHYSKERRDLFTKTLITVKSLPQRKWKPTEGYWEAEVTPQSILILAEAGFKIPEELGNYFEKEKEIAEEKAEEIARIKLKSDILWEWQREHAKTLIASIINHNAALDGSDTGTGKTFAALEVALYFNCIPIVITKKRAIPAWEEAIKLFGFKQYFVSNYEQFKLGKTEYAHKIENTHRKNKYDPEFIFAWNTNFQHMIIVDEAHSCKNKKTDNALMLQGVVESESRVLALSATIGDNPLHLYSIGLVLKLFDGLQGYWRWCFQRGVIKNNFGCEFNNSDENLLKIHKDLFPVRGHRISIKELDEKYPGAFPENLILPAPLAMDENEKKIQKIYDEMSDELGRLREAQKTDTASIFTEILRARQKIELLKVPTVVDLAQDLIDEGASVAIFVNFKETLAAICKKLKTTCIIDGSTNYEQCLQNMNDFQADKERVIVCNIKSGGVAISLHDLKGTYRRESIILPTPSAQDLVQTLGRIHRGGAKTHCIQRIIYAKNTVEEEVAQRVQEKINNIRTLNDGDTATKLEIIAYPKEKKDD